KSLLGWRTGWRARGSPIIKAAGGGGGTWQGVGRGARQEAREGRAMLRLQPPHPLANHARKIPVKGDDLAFCPSVSKCLQVSPSVSKCLCPVSLPSVFALWICQLYS